MTITHPGLELVVSFADPRQGHEGKIYQAGNWLYTGQSVPIKLWWHEGRYKHTREMTGGAFGGRRKVQDYKQYPSITVPGKYRYLYPLDKATRKRLAHLSKPYPAVEVTLATHSTTPVEKERFDSDSAALSEE